MPQFTLTFTADTFDDLYNQVKAQAIHRNPPSVYQALFKMYKQGLPRLSTKHGKATTKSIQ